MLVASLHIGRPPSTIAGRPGRSLRVSLTTSNDGKRCAQIDKSKVKPVRRRKTEAYAPLPSACLSQRSICTARTVGSLKGHVLYLSRAGIISCVWIFDSPSQRGLVPALFLMI